MNPRFALLATIALLALAVVPTAAAHKTVTTEDGAVKVVWGMRNEPATTWTKTDLDLILTTVANNTPVQGAEKTITKAQLKYGDDVLDLTLKPQHGQVGRYTSEVITMTKAGLYVLHLEGTIDGSPIDMDIPAAHENTDISDTYFPATENDPYAGGSADTSALEAQIAALNARITALEAKANTQASTPATVTPASPKSATPALGVLAVLGVVAAIVLVRRRG